MGSVEKGGEEEEESSRLEIWGIVPRAALKIDVAQISHDVDDKEAWRNA